MLFGYGIAIFITGLDLAEILGPKWTMAPSEKTLLVSVIAGSCGVLFLSVFFHPKQRKFARRIESDILKIPADEMLPATIGLIAGLIIAYLVSQLINGIEVLQTAYINTILSILLYLFSVRSARTSPGRKAGRSETFMACRAYTEDSHGRTKGKHGSASPKILDTSVIIDGRIAIS